MTFENNGIRGARYTIFSASASNASSIGSMSGEWKALAVLIGRELMPASARTGRKRSIASGAPATTMLCGPLMALSESPGPACARSSRTRWASANTLSIAPSGVSSCISRPRWAASSAPSVQSIAPATQAAASSPMLWPSRAAGSTPQERHSRATAYSRMNRAGWV